jgi:hypothetical protein
MDKKLFYGEYTLMHWVELIMRQNIVLPGYQRRFVWEKKQVERFIKSLKDGNFIPPVIIGAYNGENMILDGQQRLSSILLSYLGVVPRKEAFRVTDDPNYADADEGADMSDGVEPEAIEWTFKLLLKQGSLNSKAEMLSRTSEEKYERLDSAYCLDDTFLNSNYLGFSYIVPSNCPLTEQMKFYSTVFHDINMQGVELKAQESRRSLYYLDNELIPFFEPAVSSQLKVNQNGKTARYDFVRALAFTSQYAKQGNEYAIAKSCRRQEAFDCYFSDYINAVINDTNSTRFGKFSVQIGKNNIESRTNRLQTYVTDLGFNHVFMSIIDADTSLLGLIYFVLIKGKKLDNARYADLKNELSAKVAEFKTSDSHRRSPNAVTNLRRRVRQSIDIYQNYVV